MLVRDEIVLVLGTSVGGVGRHVRMLAEGLARLEHPVMVAGPATTQDQFDFASAGAPFLILSISDHARPLHDLRTIWALRHLRKARLVHAHGLRAGALAGLALIRARTPLVVTLHNAATATGAAGTISRLLERTVVWTTDLVLTVSHDLEERMRALGARAVAPADVPAAVLRAPTRSAEQIRAELGAHHRPILLTVARLAHQKGLETLLDVAAAHLRPDGPLFVIAGAGPLQADLQRRIAQQDLPIRMLGPRDDIPDLLSVARAIVVPSIWEGQPMIVQEALSAGVPVIATAVGGIPALVRDAGLLVPADDPPALCCAIQRVLDDADLVERMARAARQRKLPTPEQALVAVLDAYAGLNLTRHRTQP